MKRKAGTSGASDAAAANPPTSRPAPVLLSAAARTAAAHAAAEERARRALNLAFSAAVADAAGTSEALDEACSRYIEYSAKLRELHAPPPPPPRTPGAAAVYVIGSGDFGQLGLGEEATNRDGAFDALRPKPLNTLELFDTTVVEVAAGGFHSVARTSAGAVYTWGVNDDGQLGREVRAAGPCSGLPDARSAAGGCGLGGRRQPDRLAAWTGGPA